jgi:hypothetical protein
MARRIRTNGALAISTSTLGTAIVLGIVAFAASPLAATRRYSEWSTPPQNLGAPVNSTFVDIGPAISKDGLSLYFASNRPHRPNELPNFDIWVSQRDSVDSPWMTPVNLGDLINTPALESVPSLSRDGHWLFFNSDRPGGHGGVDIWASFRFDKHDDFGWQSPMNLGSGVNYATPQANCAFDGGPFLFENDDDGPRLLFFGSDRPGPTDCQLNQTAPIDIYVSEQLPDGSFGSPRPVEELNTLQNDQRAMLRSDGLELFLFSNRTGNDDVWSYTRETRDDPWTDPVKLPINSDARDAHPYLASDRETLFFSSNQLGGLGSFDLYVTTRTKMKRP